MTVSPIIDPARLIEEQLAQASPDLLRELLTTFVNTLMSAEADAVCGAAYGTSSPERIHRRNGYRHRDFDTRTGTLDLEVPKLRTGSYFPEWLLERRKRAERGGVAVVVSIMVGDQNAPSALMQVHDGLLSPVAVAGPAIAWPSSFATGGTNREGGVGWTHAVSGSAPVSTTRAASSRTFMLRFWLACLNRSNACAGGRRYRSTRIPTA